MKDMITSMGDMTQAIGSKKRCYDDTHISGLTERKKDYSSYNANFKHDIETS